ncbi:hypothetical protein L2E82_45200 [Cichorium intybus]|uniref:Uncharacterized protein n=1 Tax=Cichorium intybus TaxID=13427 RepID=A0ACB8ZS80_CICIN|nr:hypothetical protein L2E82_45200 [Cichorium intybus]
MVKEQRKRNCMNLQLRSRYRHSTKGLKFEMATIMSAGMSGPTVGYGKSNIEYSEEKKSKLSFKQRAINASNKFRTSFGKKGRKNGKLVSVVEHVHDANELKLVDAFHQALILEELLQQNMMITT